tara:strand:+ start:295 stop:1011 length:717 start_codon:yes stop_codon:yes gene_type:complete
MSTISNSDSSSIDLESSIDNDTSSNEVEKQKEANYYILEYSKTLNKFNCETYKFSDTLEEIDNLDNIKLYEIIIAHHKINYILLPIYKGKLVKKDLSLSEFKSPIIILKLDINLLVNTKTSRIPYNLLNMDINSIINTILARPQSNNANNNENEDDGNTDNVINSQNDIANITSQLMNIYSNSVTNVNNIQRETEEKYSKEIEQIMNMGFDNREKIIQSLIVCNGNVELAINYYLSIN